MDVSGRILRAWMPAIHAGMTEAPDNQNAVKYWRWLRVMGSFFMLCKQAQDDESLRSQIRSQIQGG
jgi:hypothetical protein